MINKKIKIAIAVIAIVPTISTIIPSTKAYAETVATTTAATTTSTTTTTTSTATSDAQKKFDDLIDKIKDKLEDHTYDNDETKSSIKKIVEKYADSDDYTITISDYDKNESTDDEDGDISFTVTIVDKDNTSLSDSIDIDEDISSDDSSRDDEDTDTKTALKKIVDTTIEGTGDDSKGNAIKSDNKALADYITNILDAESTISGDATSSTKQVSTKGINGTVTNIYYDGYYNGTLISGTKGSSFDLVQKNLKYKNAYVYVSSLGKFLPITQANSLMILNETMSITNSKFNYYYLTNNALEDAYVVKKGWFEQDKKTYYVGDMDIVTGWVKDSNYWYYLDATTNQKVTGWIGTTGSDRYYLDANGRMVTGWVNLAGQWYYFSKNGNVSVGWEKVDKNWYFFGDDGVMKTGWVSIGGVWYYLYQNGIMAANTTIDGYSLSKTGVLV